jgi:hypothetical protein
MQSFKNRARNYIQYVTQQRNVVAVADYRLACTKLQNMFTGLRNITCKKYLANKANQLVLNIVAVNTRGRYQHLTTLDQGLLYFIREVKRWRCWHPSCVLRPRLLHLNPLADRRQDTRTTQVDTLVHTISTYLQDVKKTS